MKKIKNFIVKSIILCIFLLSISREGQVYAAQGQALSNATRVYLSAEVAKGYGSGDCILLENYDSQGNKIYGLIDAGRNIEKKDNNGNTSTVVKEFLKKHGVQKLEFLAITHQHADHNGDALTVLDNFEVNTIYMQEFDKKWSPSGRQDIYEDIIEKAVEKNIKVIGVSYLSLTSSEISPSISKDFMKNTKNAKEELFESFNETNTKFEFGSSKIQIFNWEMFDENGNQYITGATNDRAREIVKDDNNNSIAFLLTQGNKKAFFTGDMNNLDKNEETGRIGDEDRIKDSVGKIDFLKLGHHGGEGSNTEDYMNILKPKYAAITIDMDMNKGYKNTLDWLKENNVDYLYTTEDEYGISATITNNEVYLGLETTGLFKNFNRILYYIPEGLEYEDYTKIRHKLEYTDKEIEVSNWKALKDAIDSNKNQTIEINYNKKTCEIYKLVINLKSDGDWTAGETIEIDPEQKIELISQESITILRGNNLKDSPLFLLKGNLRIGAEGMMGQIELDGNKNRVEATNVLIRIETGTLNLEKNATLCNNINKITNATESAIMIDYTSYGSAIYSNKGTININGGSIINNSQDVECTYVLPKETIKHYKNNAYGTGIYMTNESILNIYSGKISNNEALNHSTVYTNEEYTIAGKNRGITQNCSGVGVYAINDSEVNLMGGEISENSARDYAITTLKKPNNKKQITNIHSLNDGIYGVGINIEGSTLNISNGFAIFNNVAELNSKITLEENTAINTSASSAIRGLQVYANNSNTVIDGANIYNGRMSNNTQIVNDGAIGESGNASVSLTDAGGGIDIIATEIFSINNLKVSGCNSGYGGGVYIISSSGIISNSTVSENEAEYGGGVFIYGESANVEFNNVKITNNVASISGGGIYSYGNLKIDGKNTVVSNNVAKNYGGGILVRTKTIINDGEVSENEAKMQAGGGIRVEGNLTLNGGIIKNNKSKTTGGGIDYTIGTFYYNAGTIEGNIAQGEGNEIYPKDNVANTVENIERSYKIQDFYILNIENNTPKSDFDENINTKIEYKIFRNNTSIADTDIIATGDILRTSNGNEYTLIVAGDVNEDGDVNIKDVIKLRKYLLERNNLDEAEKMAADCNLDGKDISIKDLIRMRLIVLSRDVT